MFGEILILLLAIPLGFMIAWLARDELKQGRKWFRLLIILCLIIGTGSYVVGKLSITWTTLFILIISSISLMKSHDKKWLRV